MSEFFILRANAVAGLNDLMPEYYVAGTGRGGLAWVNDRTQAKRFPARKEALAWLKGLSWGDDDNPGKIRGHSQLGVSVVQR